MTMNTDRQPGALAHGELYERLAAIEHERWADWQMYLHSLCTFNPDGSLTIPADRVAHWSRQIATPYADLSPYEKQSDREQVDRYWPLLLPFLNAAVNSLPVEEAQP